MSEEKKDAVEETQPSESSTEKQEVQPEKDGQGIPHARVKEMVERAKVKGREEAMAELLEEREEVKETPKTETTETDEARKILKETVSDALKPYFIRQEVDKFLDKTPDALNYIDDIKSLRKRTPGLSWEDAYKLASHEDKIREASQKREEKKMAEVKSEAQTEKPSPETPRKETSLADKFKDSKVKSEDLKKELEQELKRRLNR